VTIVRSNIRGLVEQDLEGVGPIHQVLQSHGFSPLGGNRYKHPDSGRVVGVHPDNNGWSHYGGSRGKSGKGPDELDKFLSS